MSALAAAVCAPYLANVKQALDSTVGRTAGAHHPWYVFGPIDSINSLLFPVGASPEGCNYFGAAGRSSWCCTSPASPAIRMLGPSAGCA